MSLSFEYFAFSKSEPKSSFSEYYNFSGGQIVRTIGSAINALIISALIKFTFDNFLLQKQQLEQSKSRLETEMKYLKAQINPHFLFNTLNSLLYLTRNKSDLAPDVVEKLSELMRYLLEHNDIDEIPLLKEVEFIKAYLELEKIRIPHVSVNFKVNIKNENINIPTMLLLPLVENAFKHGINKNNSENYVHIEINETDDIILTVENSLWLNNTIDNSRDGMGINNLKKRLDLLFGNNYKLTFDKNKKVFKSKLIIPKI
ncbi:sensor histidine kinase [Pontimicrobium aquaticum]|uniref:sensor histidine kinase n=1 Tax=Pontimicrobium aquaticum TaxID=2565367 RepID=UPI00145DCD01|nr:histidine kinase [Pontimicrobium aquaticum]